MAAPVVLDTGNSASGLTFSDKERQLLADVIRRRSFKTGNFTLASGKSSTRYFNNKPTLLDSHDHGALFAALAFIQIAKDCGAEYVSGLEMGAVPTIGAMAALAPLCGMDLRATFVRKKAKGHGTQVLIEGLTDGESLSGRNVLVIDDVATTGGSTLQAAEGIRAAGGIVTHAAALVDREEGGAQLLADHGITLHRVFSADEIAGDL